MPLLGDAFLCLWNDFDEARAEEYERWHSFEHVPERVAAPGFLSGRRYGAYDRRESRYMTLYDLDSLAALETPQYAELQAEPTPWSARMRPGFRNFLRIPCRTLASEGTGCAGRAGVLALRLSDDTEASDAAILGLLRGALSAQAISAFHLGRADHIPAYGVFRSPEASAEGRHYVVAILEATTEAAAAAALAGLRHRLDALDPEIDVLRDESTEFLLSVTRSEVVPRWERHHLRQEQPAS
ncbi:hypothetical protein [Salipiger mangrovisoli]|uniref:NIPSNAP protein n=1 Tax=Salipiger mangrovisoli TaxID=2865933 RepID=A0ABR9X5B1_9RHOB|nr:hypothetical protein [Salipiger mangrovisoli]MBE9638636.1 hypothetical protein [Salipiger mangrovisoli]